MHKLLLVDDERIIREGLVQMIDWRSAELRLTSSCGNALAALDSMMDDMPDILLTDVRMPGVDGLELTERALALHPQLQVIILSGYDTFEYARKAIHSGVREYLLKPCSRQELNDTLARVCLNVEKEKRHLIHLYGEREARIRTLAEKLREIRENGAEGDALEKQLRELEHTAEDPMLIREALIHVITEDNNALQAEWSMNTISQAVHQSGELVRLLADALTRMRLEAGARGSVVRKMTDYVNAHYADERLSLQFLADNIIFMNSDYIGREFSKAMNCRFSSFLLEKRMEKAKQLMENDLHSYEIAERIGLGNNPHYFSQVFRKYTGMTPTEYRASLRSESPCRK